MATITKYGDDFYVIERLACMGHRDRDGRILSGSAVLTFAFRRPEDSPHVNVDPFDVLQVLIEHLEGKPHSGEVATSDILRLAQRSLSPSGADDGSSPSPPRRGPGRATKQPVAA